MPLNLHMEIERRVIQREREVIKSALFRVCLLIIALDVEGKRDVCENGGRLPPAVPLRPVFEKVQPVSVVSPVLCRHPFVFHIYHLVVFCLLARLVFDGTVCG